MNERDRRVVIMAALDRGETVAHIARMTGASPHTVRRVREHGVERARREQAPRPARTPELVEQVRREVEENPRQSINALARDHGVSRRSMQRLVKDLGLYSYAKARGCQFNPRIRRNRVELAQGIMNRLRHGDAGKVILFSDERYFTIAPYHNRRNDQVGGFYSFFLIFNDFRRFFQLIWRKGELQEAPDDLRVVGVEQRPEGVMVLGVFASNGAKCPPFFFPEGNINAQVYMEALAGHVAPWIDDNFQPGTWVFQQDGAKPHVARQTQEWLAATGWEFWDKSVWPARSADINPLDYSIWDSIAKVAQKERAPSKEVLRQRISAAWDEVDPAYVRKTCRSFRRRLQKVVDKEGGYIDK